MNKKVKSISSFILIAVFICIILTTGVISVGQVVEMYSGEQLAYDEAVLRAQKANDNNYIEKITAYYDAFLNESVIGESFMAYRNMQPTYLRGSKEKSTLQLAAFFISGGSDYITPFASVQHYAEQVQAPIVEMCIISDTGHNPFLDDSEAFAEEIIRIYTLMETTYNQKALGI